MAVKYDASMQVNWRCGNEVRSPHADIITTPDVLFRISLSCSNRPNENEVTNLSPINFH
jgi:hypothetical protein